jgi:RND family efflux transporter MFP subunit
MPRDYHVKTSWIAVVVACLAIAGCSRKPPAGKTEQAPRVTVAHPTIRSLVDEDDYNGWLEAFKTVEVRARVRGHITKVHFKDGDFVKEGDPLFDLDPAPFEADLKQAEAQERAFDAQRVAARKDAERYAILVKQKAVSQQEFEKVVADAESFDAQIAAKKAEADRRRLDLKYAKIVAPLTGKISKAALVEGNLVNAGGSDPLLTTIVAVDPIYVDFNVDERAIQRYQEADTGRKGTDKQPSLREQKLPFAFGLDTEKGFPHPAQLVFADNKYTEGTGTILVRGVAPNPDGRLIPGSRVRVRVPVSDKYEGTLVPDTAVNTDQDKKYLLLVGEGNIVKRQNVVLGRLLDDGMRVVLEPKLDPGASIIVEGMERARLNYPVEPIAESAPPAAPSTK